MENQVQVQQNIIKLFDSQFQNDLSKEDGILLYHGDGFMPLVLNVIQESSHQQLISLGHYFEHEGLPYPDPSMHFSIDREKNEVIPLTYTNTIHVTKAKHGEQLEDKVINDLREFLHMWLNNIIMQGYSLVSDYSIWERQPQEKEGDYLFNGRVLMTRGYIQLLNPFEIFSISLNLEAFVLHKGLVDYLQVFRKKGSNDKIYCVD